MMASKRRKPADAARRRIVRLNRELASVEAQIARLEKDTSLGLAQRDHFALWRRPSLFGGGPSERLQ
jgi:hypothetical protein